MKKFSIRSIFYIPFIICLLGAHIVKSQSKAGSLSNGFIPDVVPPSPTAASLGKFGAWPVSYYTGTPEISIPVYDIKSRKLSLPVSLSYHASGVKVEEMSGWVGTGWALNAGGVITRSIIGLPDNETTGFYTRMREGKFLNSSYTLTDPNTFVLFKGITEGDIDTEPDVYFFNFNGRSGKFFFDERGNFHCIPENALKITKNPLLSTSTDGTWELVDENGTTYTFGPTDVASGGLEQSEIVNTDATAAQNFWDNAWYLTRMVSNDKSDTISLQYTDKSESYTMRSTQSLRELTAQMGGYPADVNTSWTDILNTSKVLYNGVPNNDPMNTRYVTRGKGLLSSIRWSQGEMTFFAGSSRQDLQQGKLLDSIKVRATETGNNIKNFVLQYSYDGNRYYLDSLSDYNRTRTDKLVHSFYYYPGLPSRFSNAQDHWGYYNAAANQNLLPSAPSFQTPIFANREPNESAAKSGTLKRIKYPTGGYTDFDYELHRYEAGSIPNTPIAEIGEGRAYASTYNYKTPMPHDSIVFFDIPFSQDKLTISISYANYTRPNAKREGWLPFVRLERSTGDGNYVLVQEWNAYDQFPGGNIPANPDGTYDFSFPSIELPSLFSGSYRLTTDNSCSGFRCPEDNSTKAAIYADIWFKKYVEAPAGGGLAAPVAGGLRIKSMTNYDGLNITPSEIKTYKYSTGKILSYPRYVHYYAVDMFGVEGHTGMGPCNTDFAQYREVTSSSQAILGVTQGSSVGYTSVQEFNVDNQGNDNGYVEYNYLFYPDSTNNYYFDHTYWPNVDLQTAIASIPVNDYSYKRGLLSEKTVYAKNGIGYRKVSSQKDEYAFNDGDTTNLYRRMKGLRVKRLRVVEYPCFNEVDGQHIPVNDHFEFDYGYGFYNVITSWVQKVSTEQKTYDTQDGSELSTLIRYYYDNNKHLNVTRTITTDSKGNELTTYNKYPHEMVAGGQTTPYNDMIARNMIGNVIEERTVKTAGPELSMTRINYSVFTGTLIAPSRLENALMGNPAEEAALIQQYDDKGNVIQYKERNGLVQSLIFDHKSSSLVAKVTNASINTVAYTGFESTGNGYWQLSGAVSVGNAFSGKNFYTLSRGNIVRNNLSTATAYTVSYWSQGGAALVNGQTGTAGRTSNGWTFYKHQIAAGTATITISGSASIDELRLHPQNAQMNTYTYDPLVGVTSQSDAAGNVTYYEYDGFGRLRMIKDNDRNILKVFDYQYSRSITQ